MKKISLDPSPAFSFRVMLEDALFFFRIRWVHIASQWFVDMDCPTLNIHYKGFALVIGNNLLHGRAGRALGGIILVDLQGEEDPARVGLGDRWKLYYLTREELDAL